MDEGLLLPSPVLTALSRKSEPKDVTASSTLSALQRAEIRVANWPLDPTMILNPGKGGEGGGIAIRKMTLIPGIGPLLSLHKAAVGLSCLRSLEMGSANNR